MTENDGQRLRTHIVIYEIPAWAGKTAVPVRIGQDWGVVTGYASPAAVWTLFAAARRWWHHCRQKQPDPQQTEAVTAQLAQAATDWLRSARERNEHHRPGRPESHAEHVPVPPTIFNTQHYIAEITARASRLAWDLEEDADSAESTRNLLATIEAFRRPKDQQSRNQPKKKPKSQRPKSEAVLQSMRLDEVKAELLEICRPLSLKLQENLARSGSQELKEESTKEALKNTLTLIRPWYDRYLEAAQALDDPQEREQAMATINRDATAYPRRPQAQLRNAACNIEQHRRKLKEGRPGEALKLLLDAATTLAREPHPAGTETAA